MKPETIPANYDAIPAELRALPSWLLWDYRLIDDEWTKSPLIADDSRRSAKSNDIRTWRSFPEARQRAGTVSGIGMVLTTSYCGIDLDCCRNRESGELADWAERIVAQINSYTEASPSGEGLHIIVKLKRELPKGRRLRGGKKKLGWEIAIYDQTSPRYFAMTGVVVGDPKDIRLCDPQEFYPEFEMGGFDPKPINKTKTNGQAHPQAHPGENGRNTTRGDKRAQLIRGEWEKLYGSQSEADAALVWYFAYDYDNDPALIDKAFRNSGLMRDKWDEPRPGGTYGSVTIAHCLAERAKPRNGLLAGKDGQTRSGLANAIALLRKSPEWDGVLGYNEFSLYVASRKPAPWQKAAGNWTDFDDSRTTEWFAWNDVHVRTQVTAEAVHTVAKEHPFHPVRDYLNSVIWDGEPRIDQWLSHYLGCEDTPFARAIGQRWLISAVARIFRPGCQADYVLLLEGPQGIRKSTALQTLAGDDWFTDHISDLGSKDSRIELHGKWIVEFSELATVRRGELDKVKAFLTARIDHFRMPYGRRGEAIPRSCVFAGTVNDQTPFTDPTGNRRFWPVRCGAVDIDALLHDRDLLWAEAYDRFKAGQAWWLETAELNQAATAEQDERYDPGVWDDVILDWVENPKQSYDRAERTPIPLEPFDSEPGRVTVTDILLHAIRKPLDHLTHSDRNQVVRCLSHAGWKRKQIRLDSGQRKWFYVRSLSPVVTSLCHQL